MTRNSQPGEAPSDILSILSLLKISHFRLFGNLDSFSEKTTTRYDCTYSFLIHFLSGKWKMTTISKRPNLSGNLKKCTFFKINRQPLNILNFTPSIAELDHGIVRSHVTHATVKRVLLPVSIKESYLQTQTSATRWHRRKVLISLRVLPTQSLLISQPWAIPMIFERNILTFVSL